MAENFRFPASEEWETDQEKELKEEVAKNGVLNVKEFCKLRLEQWREVEVNIAITGDSGAGKSSFINAIRGLHEDDKGAAPVGVTERPMKPTGYAHPTNPNIKFWDLPGIGTPNYPDLETYCEKVNLEKYHTFLIFTVSRFTKNDLELAKKIREIKKKFFFIRTKIDENVRAESRKKSFNEEKMLAEIRQYCVENLGDLLSNEPQEIFLISNHLPDKWEFVLLTEAILDALTRYQRESLTLSLGNVIMRSVGIFQRKVDVLRGRRWLVASASAAVALVPLPGLSFGVDTALIMEEFRFYIEQLGLPEKGSAEFEKLRASTKEKVLKAGLTTIVQLSGILAAYAMEGTIEEATRFIPFVGLPIASAMSFGATFYALTQLLKNVEEVALLVLTEAAKRAAAELEKEID